MWMSTMRRFWDYRAYIEFRIRVSCTSSPQGGGDIRQASGIGENVGLEGSVVVQWLYGSLQNPNRPSGQLLTVDDVPAD